MPSKLSPKQELFCQEYLIDLNATQAAIRCGYSPKTANEQASRLLANVNIMTRINELKSERMERTRITADRVVQEIERIALIDVKDIVEIQSHREIAKLPEDVRRAIMGWKYTEYGLELKLAKEKALEMLGRHHKLFTDKVEHSGTIKLEDLVAGDKDE